VTISRIPDGQATISRIPNPNFGESRFPGKSLIPNPVKIFCVFPNPAPYFGQNADPENTLPDPGSSLKFFRFSFLTAYVDAGGFTAMVVHRFIFYPQFI